MAGSHPATLVPVIVSVAMLCSCSTASSTLTPLAAPRLSPSPSAVDVEPLVLSTSEPTASPESALPTECPVPAPPAHTPGESLSPGQYVAYYLGVAAQGFKWLVIKSADGDTANLTALPPEVTFPDPFAEAGISPDGRYFVYYTGGPSFQPFPEFPAEFDLAINIASTTGDAPPVVIPLIGPDLPEGIRHSAEGLANNPPPELEGATVDEVALHLLETFLVGITTAAWSPDGRFLAFSGALHGPSSDIYLYDTASKSIRRLTDGPEHIQKIQWSPDGAWIMHISALLSFAESAISNHAVKADGTSVITFPDIGQYDRGWLSNSQYLVAAGGPTSSDLAILDLRDGSSRVVWPHTFGALQPNDAGTVILLTTFGDAPDDPPYGLYALNVSDSAFEQLDDFPLWYPAPWSTPPYDFVAVKEGKGLFGVMPDRSIVPVLEGDWWIAISPDHQSLALFGSESSPGVYHLTDLPSSPVKVDTVQPTQVQWSIDSSHLLLTRGYATGDQSLLTVDVAGGQPLLIQDLPHGLCGNPSPTWINVR